MLVSITYAAAAQSPEQGVDSSTSKFIGSSRAFKIRTLGWSIFCKFDSGGVIGARRTLEVIALPTMKC